ncbi:MAG: type II secretion system F family protein [Clostridia bacterium]|nr:type II secretion system F family protein [Clostridia bacterium]
MNGLQISIVILSVSFGLFSFFLWVSIMGTATKDRRSVEKRFDKITNRKSGLTVQLQEKKKKRKSMLLSRATGGTEKQSVQRKKLMDTIFNELILADIMMKPEEFCIIWLLLTFVPAGLAALFQAGLMPSATLAAIGAFTPIIFIKTKKGKRIKAFEAQLGDTLIMMCNGLRSGFSFQQTMENVATDMPAPIGIEFSRVCNEIRYGATMEDALNNMVDRVKSADLMLVVSAVLIQRTTGGNLSEILTTISDTIRDRVKIKGEISSITAQGRMSGLIIGALPICIAAVLMVMNPDYMSTFFTTTAGKIMLIVSVVMEIIGFFAIRKVVTIEY